MGVSVGSVVLLLFIGIPICVVIGVCCVASRSNRPVQTRVMATTTPTATTNTVSTSNQPGTSFSAPAPHLQQNVYKDAQFSCQDAPPSYFEATAFPQTAEVTSVNAPCI